MLFIDPNHIKCINQLIAIVIWNIQHVRHQTYAVFLPEIKWFILQDWERLVLLGEHMSKIPVCWVARIGSDISKFLNYELPDSYLSANGYVVNVLFS